MKATRWRHFYSGVEALAHVKHERFDLAILDIMMPEVDGLSLCQAIRQRYQYPIIMLTAKGETMDKDDWGWTLGGRRLYDKAFTCPLELVARVKAQLRRYKTYNQMQEPEDPEGLIIYGGLVLDVESHECTLNERPLVLTPTEFAILRILCEHKGGVVSAEELFRGVWGEE